MNISIILFRKGIRMEDKRNVKTERLIRTVFLELLKEKSINEITVAEISRKADLGRGTFISIILMHMIYMRALKKR